MTGFWSLRVGTVLLAVFAAISTARGVGTSFTWVEVPTGFDVLALSSDGSAFASRSTFLGPVRWTRSEGVQSFSPFITGTGFPVPRGVSSGSSVVVGYSSLSQHKDTAWKWTAPGSVAALPLSGTATGSYATAVSNSGAVVVGKLEYGDYLQDTSRACRWNGSSVQLLDPVGNQNSFALGMNSDGSAITGSLGQGCFRWRASGGFENLGGIAGARMFPYGVSADGSVLSGTATLSTGLNGAYRWTQASGFSILPLPAGATEGGVTAMDASGNFSVGFYYAQSGARACFWTPTDGCVDLTNWLVSRGQIIPPSVNNFTSLSIAQGVSADGRTIAGLSAGSAWVATIPAPSGGYLLATALCAVSATGRRRRY